MRVTSHDKIYPPFCLHMLFLYKEMHILNLITDICQFDGNLNK